MIDVLEFVFSDIFHFLGSLLIIYFLFEGVEGVMRAWRGKP